LAQTFQSTGPKPRLGTPPTEGIQSIKVPVLVLVHPGQKSLKTEGLPELKSWDSAPVSRAKSSRVHVTTLPDTGAHPEDGLQLDGCLQIHFIPCQRKTKRPLIPVAQGFVNEHTGGKCQTADDEHESPWGHHGTADLPQTKSPPQLESSVFRSLFSSLHPSHSAFRLVIDIHGCCAVDGVKSCLRL